MTAELTTKPDCEILIVGAGPAGLSAGIYSARAGHNTLILERGLVGGQMAMTAHVENYPGFANEVSGMELAQAMESQATRFGCRLVTSEITALTPAGEGFQVSTTDGNIVARAVIVCTGARPRNLSVPGEKELTGRGVSYCAVCDGPFFRDKEVAVIGGGDSALDEAYYLSNIVRHVHLVHRREAFRGSSFAVQRLRQRPNVTFHLSRVVQEFSGTDKLEAVILRHLPSGQAETLPVSGAFIYVGWLPNTAWCQELLTLDATGAIVTDDRLQTSLPGVFAAGDVRATRLRQIATAVGDGALAAMMAHEYLAARFAGV